MEARTAAFAFAPSSSWYALMTGAICPSARVPVDLSISSRAVASAASNELVSTAAGVDWAGVVVSCEFESCGVSCTGA
jgi:hypothetical protein